jgi:hypothetical protein
MLMQGLTVASQSDPGALSAQFYQIADLPIDYCSAATSAKRK